MPFRREPGPHAQEIRAVPAPAEKAGGIFVPGGKVTEGIFDQTGVKTGVCSGGARDGGLRLGRGAEGRWSRDPGRA